MRGMAKRGAIALVATAMAASGLLAPTAQAAEVPVTHRDTYAGDTGQPLSIGAPGVLANDSGFGPGYRVILLDDGLSISEHATLDLRDNGSFTFDPNDATASGESSFFYCIAATGSDSCVSNRSMVQLFLGEAYVADHQYSVAAGGSLTVSAPGLLMGSRNPGPDDELYLKAQADHGVAVVQRDGAFVYTPEAGFSGTDTFKYCWSTPELMPSCSGYWGIATITVTAAPADVTTTTTLTGAGTRFYGEPVNLTATVTPSNSGGTVRFAEAGTALPGCAAVPVTGATAICTPSTPLVPDNYSITAGYSGSTGALPSTSAPVTVIVTPAPTAVAYTGDTSGTIGSPMEVSARLTNAAPAATGAVAGRSVRFGMTDGLRCTAVTDSAGIATCTLTPNRSGSLAVTALFPGDTHYLTTQIDGVTTVTGRASSTTVAATPNPVPWGEDVTLSATVPASATGTVAFAAAGAGIPGCAAVPVAAGSARCVTSALDVGSQQVTADYSGDAEFAGSDGSTTVQVQQRAVTIAYTGPTTGTVGNTLALNARVTDVLSGEPVAGLRLDLSFQGLACGATTDSSGVTGCNVFLRRAGTSDAEVTFSGDTHYTPTDGSGEVTIDKAGTTTTATVDVSDPDFAAPITVTADVQPTDGGTVTFNDGGVPIADCASVPLVAAGGQSQPWTATCTTATLTAGPHSLDVIYSGTDNYLGSEGSTALTVSPAPSALAYTGETSGTVGGSLLASAALTTTAGPDPLPVAGQSLEFSWGDRTCTAATGHDGTASCRLPITSVAQAGELRATFVGTIDYAEAHATTTVSVDPAGASIGYLGKTKATVGTPLTVGAGLSVTPQPVLTRAHDGLNRIGLLRTDAPDLAGLRLRFTLGSEQCEGATDADGVASCSLTPTAAGDPAELTIDFAGTADLNAARLATSITVTAAPVPPTTPSKDDPTGDDPTSTTPTGTTSPSAALPSATGLPATGMGVGGGFAALGLLLLGIGTVLLAGRRRVGRHLY